MRHTWRNSAKESVTGRAEEQREKEKRREEQREKEEKRYKKGTSNDIINIIDINSSFHQVTLWGSSRKSQDGLTHTHTHTHTRTRTHPVTLKTTWVLQR